MEINLDKNSQLDIATIHGKISITISDNFIHISTDKHFMVYTGMTDQPNDVALKILQ